jgi:DNA-nicking Smr family endonuclease
MKASRLSVASFKELKAALEKKRKAEAGNPPPTRTYRKKSRKTPQKTEEELFREAMSGVREIAEFREIQPKKPPGFKPPPAREENGVEALREIINGRRKITLTDTDEYVEWVRPGMRRDVAGRLHKGEFSVQDYIDLHGLTEEEAEGECAAFIRLSVRKRLFCVKVIHGRGLRSPGGPVLKRALERWLRGPLRKHVLAYATARDVDGGLGATYVLLKHV